MERIHREVFPPNHRAPRTGRTRIARACDRCKKRKSKCTGLQPCQLCSEAQAVCSYTTPHLRDRPSAVATEPVGMVGGSYLESSDLSAPTAPMYLGLDRPVVRQPLQPPTGPSQPQNEVEQMGTATQPDSGVEPASRASPEPTQTDLEGHYVGPSSGVAFLLRMQKRLTSTFAHGIPIFSFGDAPLYHGNAALNEGLGQGAASLDASPAFYLSLSPDYTEKLVARYFDFAVPLDRFLHRPTIESWLAEFHETAGAMRSRSDAASRSAVLFMVFANAQEHIAPQLSQAQSEMSLRYYLAANQQLAIEQGAVRLASVQARLCQCLWLLSQSRINHCWSLFGTVARLAVAIGLHRQRSTEPLTLEQLECRRRTFWSAYSLDNYLSAALGRPRTFHDDDIDQELPADLDDRALMGSSTTRTLSQSVMFGPIAYAKLSRITSGILHDLYGIGPVPNRASIVEKYAEEINAWHSDVVHFLGTDPSHAMPLIPIYQRQKNTLNLAYWHAIILTHRPLLLSNFSNLWKRKRSRSNAAAVQTSTRNCIKAAMNIVNTVDAIIEAGQLYRAFWFTPYFAFSASVILYIYAIQQSHQPEKLYGSYLVAAEKCQSQIATIAGEGSLPSRYCLILEELRMEAHHQISINRSNAALPNESVAVAPIGEENADFAHMVGVDFNVSPSDSMADITSWGQFDSMVMSGFPGLEAFLGNDNDGFAALPTSTNRDTHRDPPRPESTPTDQRIR